MHKSQIKRHTNTISLDIYIYYIDYIYCISYTFNIYDYLLFYTFVIHYFYYSYLDSRHFFIVFYVDGGSSPRSLPHTSTQQHDAWMHTSKTLNLNSRLISQLSLGSLYSINRKSLKNPSSRTISLIISTSKG